MVGLTGPDGQAAHDEVAYQPQHPTPAVEAACPGVVVSADGTEARMERPGPSDEDDLIIVWRDELRTSAGPGPIFGSDDNPPVPGSSSTHSAIVGSLAPAPTDDPRLTERALDQETVAHPSTVQPWGPGGSVSASGDVDRPRPGRGVAGTPRAGSVPVP
jgi:hypothetical protein